MPNFVFGGFAPLLGGDGGRWISHQAPYHCWYSGSHGQKVEQKAWRWWLKHRPKDIMLTTDRCRTFTKVGEFAPRAETPARYGDDLFWIAAEGVMVTRDRGRSWKVMGKPIKDLMFGPFFGSNKDTMLVVSKNGLFKTSDAGENWTKLADAFVPEGLKIELAHPGWDPIHNVVYLGFLGDDVYRMRLDAPSRGSLLLGDNCHSANDRRRIAGTAAGQFQ